MTQHDIDMLVLVASNWSGEHWNRCRAGLAGPWKRTQGDHRQGWNLLRAQDYIKRELVDPCCKAEAKREGKTWAVEFPCILRQAAALEIVGQMVDEFELEVEE